MVNGRDIIIINNNIKRYFFCRDRNRVMRADNNYIVKFQTIQLSYLNVLGTLHRDSHYANNGCKSFKETIKRIQLNFMAINVQSARKWWLSFLCKWLFTSNGVRRVYLIFFYLKFIELKLKSEQNVYGKKQICLTIIILLMH